MKKKPTFAKLQAAAARARKRVSGYSVAKRASLLKAARSSVDEAGSQQRLVRHPDRVSELSAKISNDISEDMDCGESREKLRQAVREWADEACEANRRRAEAETHLKLLAPALGLLEHSIGIVRVVLGEMPNNPGERPARTPSTQNKSNE